MEPLAPIPFPPAADAAEDVALNEVDVAIALVAHGVAVRVRIAGLSAAIAEAVAGIAAARAGSAGLRLRRRALVERRDVHGSGRVPEEETAEPEPSARRQTSGAVAPPIGGSSSSRRRRPTSATPPGRPRGEARRDRVGQRRRAFAARTRRVPFGRPLASDEESSERLSKVKALAVFSSDNLSSVAYATEAILFTLLAAGQARSG